MRRTFALTATVVVFVLALAFSSPYAPRTVKAVPSSDPCTKCLEKVQRDFEKCEAKHGVGQFCYDQFNEGIVHCYATVCEQ
jgi:hypothetical protein